MVQAIQSAVGHERHGEGGEVFVLPADLAPGRDRLLMHATARDVILARQVCRGVSRVSLDGTPLSEGALVPLSDDGREHRVEVVLG
jgi:hypothetical protein